MSQHEYQRLRELLLKPEQQRLNELEAHAITPAQRLRELNQVLPTAIEQSAGDGRLADALAEPIKHGLRSAIREDAKGLADVLFPVMGPSIRRAIAEALRDFVSSINSTVAQAVSWQGVRWRFEAMRSGRSYGEVVLSHTLSYQVEQALLIHRDSGLLISKAELAEVVSNDSDAFSAMLGAIQDFVSDSLHGDSELSTLDMGERTIWIIRGPHAHLACIISGLPQQLLREYLADVLDEVHNSFGGLIKDFYGDASSVSGIDRYTAQCIGNPVRQQEQRATPRWPMYVLLALLFCLAWLLWRGGSAPFDQRISKALANQPGLIVQSVEASDRGWELHVLRDPLAAEPRALLQQAGLPVEKIQVHARAYQSLEPELLLPRIRASLGMPEQVRSELLDGDLRLSGRAPWRWLNRLNNTAVLPVGVSRIDSSQVEPEYGLQSLRQQLPKGVELRVVDKALQFRGEVELGWIRQLPQWLAGFATLPLAERQYLRPREWGQVKSLAADIHQQSLYFSDMMQLADGEAAKLEQLRAKLQRLDDLMQALGAPARLTITAWSDGLGSRERNEEIRTLRAAKIDKMLNPEGGLQMPVVRHTHPQYVESSVADLNLRRVDLAVAIEPPVELLP